MSTRAALPAVLAFALIASAWTSGAQEPAASERRTFDPARVAIGAQLAAIGNCRTCHTASGGKAFSGGRPLETPFGTLYSSNITPDVTTGIGGWTPDDFRRAMHEGIGRDGRQLYPAFPYDHFTRITDDDVAALYAYAMTRDPVSARPPPNRLVFPANLRPMLRVWKALYFTPGRFVPDPARSAEWNRGAYLVQGLAHCGACHTPRNAAGAEKTRQPLEGGNAEHWDAPALGAASTSPLPWTASALFAYLRRGFDVQHGIATGPMAPVVDNLAEVPEGDVRAIATYLTGTDDKRAAGVAGTAFEMAAAREFDVLARPAPDHAAGARAGSIDQDRGEVIFAGACATCHYTGGSADARRPVPLGLASSVNGPDARNALRIVLHGMHPEAGEAGAIMPGFAGALTDAQTVAVVEYVRARFSDRPPWRDVANTLRTIEKEDAQ